MADPILSGLCVPIFSSTPPLILVSQVNQDSSWVLNATDGIGNWFTVTMNKKEVDEQRNAVPLATSEEYYKYFASKLTDGLISLILEPKTGGCLLKDTSSKAPYIRMNKVSAEQSQRNTQLLLMEFAESCRDRKGKIRGDDAHILTQLKQREAEIAALQSHVQDMEIQSQSLAPVSVASVVPIKRLAAAAKHTTARKPGHSIINPYVKATRKPRGAQFESVDDDT